MYKFYYKYIKTKYNAKLLFTNSESLVYEIEPDDVYEDFYEDKNLLNFSDYPRDSKFFDFVNKKVIGKMKDKFKREIISVFVEFKSKTYSIVSIDGKNNKKAKGVNKNVVENTRHKEFVDVLFNKKLIKHRMKRIQSKLHRIGIYAVCKISLSFFDDKRYILYDDINSFAYFHKDIRGQ